jgi:biopolymer transport protein ExbD
MPIVTPGRRLGSAFGSRAQTGKLGTTRRTGHAALFLTPMVDMFTIMVLYLIQQFSATGQFLFVDPEVKLPRAQRAAAIAGNPPVITITNETISVQGKAVEDTSVLQKDGGWQAPRLEQALRDLRQLSTDVEKSTGGRVVTDSAQGIVMVQADLTVPYVLVKKVLFIASKAGFGRADFAVSPAAAAAPTPPRTQIP